jgi:dethiobiotin synthetase
MNNIFFIAGTDTGIGKTEITCAFMRMVRLKNQSVMGMKPISAGTEDINGRRINRDVEMIMQEASYQKDVSIVNPYAFEDAIAPHISIEKMGCEINFEHISNNLTELKKDVDYLFVEGAGGHEVPLGNSKTMSDLVSYLDIPIILVVGIRLGCISHTILTIQSMAYNNQKLFGWVANCIDPKMLAIEDNLAFLKQRISAPLIGAIPFQDPIATSKVAAYLDWPVEL